MDEGEVTKVHIPFVRNVDVGNALGVSTVLGDKGLRAFLVRMLLTLFVDTDFVYGGRASGVGSCEGVVTNFSTFPSDLRGLSSR